MNRKQIITATVLYILWNAIIYFAFAFTQWDINPENWEEISRLGDVLLGWVIGLIIYPLVKTNNTK